MDKRTDVGRPADTIPTRDRAGLDATYGDPSAISNAPFTDDTAPGRETAGYTDTRAEVSTTDTGSTRSNMNSGTSGKTRTPEEIERDIERTRAEMSETIDEIEERLSPHHIRQEIKGSLHDTLDSARERLHPAQLRHAGKRAGKNMFEAIKDNPIPAIITGLGLAWWMKSASEQGGNDFRTQYATRYPQGRQGRYDYLEEETYYRGEPRLYGERTYGREPRYEQPSRVSQAREKASQMRHQASSRMHEVADRASDVAHRVGDRASEFAHDIQHRAERPIEAIREHPSAILPIPALLIGAGVAWWLYSSREERQSEYRGVYPRGLEDQYGYGDINEDVYYRSGEPVSYEGTSGTSTTSGETQSKAGQLKSQLSEKTHELTGRASSAAQEAQHRAEEMAHEAQTRMYRTGRQMRYGARRATNWMDHLMHENPIAAGALMLGAGALLGLALPRTRREDEFMGPTRDHLMEEAMDMAHGYAERAGHVAEHATHEVRQSVKEVAKDVVRDVAKDAMTAVKDETKEHFGGGGTSESSTASTSGTQGTTSGITGQVGGSSSGSAQTEATSSETGTQSDRNKSGSNR